MIDLKPINNLVNTWKKRREKLRKECFVGDKKDTPANQRNSNIAYGKFQEASKCSGDLRRVLNKMVNDGVVQEGTAQNSKVKNPEYHNRCLFYCKSHKNYHHDGIKIVLSYCIRLQRSIHAEQFDQVHPTDCPVNSMRLLAGLEKIQ